MLGMSRRTVASALSKAKSVRLDYRSQRAYFGKVENRIGAELHNGGVVMLGVSARSMMEETTLEVPALCRLEISLSWSELSSW